MNNDLGDSGQWRSTVENRLSRLETRVDEEARLRATMDQDMGNLKTEFRAQRSLLQALHDTQQEHTARLERVEGRLVNVEGRLDRVEGRLDRVEGRLERVEGTLHQVHTGVEAIREMLDRTLNSDN